MEPLKVWQAFWRWYERHYLLTVGVASGLFLLQLIHLFWMAAHVVAVRLIGHSYFPVASLWQLLIALVDYAEIPALAARSAKTGLIP